MIDKGNSLILEKRNEMVNKREKHKKWGVRRREIKRKGKEKKKARPINSS